MASSMMKEWGQRPVEVPAHQVLQEWLTRNAALEIQSDDSTRSAMEAAEATPSPGYRALTLNFATNAPADPAAARKNKGAIFELLAELEYEAERSGARAAGAKGQAGPKAASAVQVVLQHPDSIHRFLEALSEKVNAPWTFDQMALHAAVTFFCWPVTAAQAVYYGYRYLWQSQADSAVLVEMLQVEQQKRRLGPDEVLALRIQAPTGEDWTLLLLQVPSLESLRKQPSVARRAWTALRKNLLGSETQPPAQLKPTLVAFLQQGRNDETTEPASLP